MKIMIPDQLEKIPPFNETDLTNKIIISITSDLSMHSKNISYAIAYSKNVIRFRGARNNNFDYVVYWFDIYNNGITLLDLIKKECEAIYDAGMSVYYTILENEKDVENFVINNNLVNTNLGTELKEYWQNNHNMVIQKETQP